jgi:hypothetical protein
MTGSSPKSVQAKGKPAAAVATTTQTPKAIIKNESTVSMMDKGRSRRLVPQMQASGSIERRELLQDCD